MGEVTFDFIAAFYPLLVLAAIITFRRLAVACAKRFSHRKTSFNLLDNLASLILGELTWHNRLRARGPWIWPGI